MKSCVTLALVPQIKSGPWIYWHDLETNFQKAAGLGFDGIELFTASTDAVPRDHLTTLVNRFGLPIAAVGTGAGKVVRGLTLTDPNPDVRSQAVAFIQEMIAFGAHFGAPSIIGSMQGNASGDVSREQALCWLAEGLNTVGQYAETQGVPLIYEPLNRYETNLINCLEDGVAFLQSLATRNVKLLADLFHMNIEESSLPDSIRAHGASIGHVHFADGNRRPIGFGHTAMLEIAEALAEIGYAGYVSAEAFPWPNPDQAAEQTINSYRHYFSTSKPTL